MKWKERKAGREREEPGAEKELQKGPKPVGAEPDHGDRYVRSEEPVLIDGQLGGRKMANGPEGANPEGSVDISNNDYREGTTSRRKPSR